MQVLACVQNNGLEDAQFRPRELKKIPLVALQMTHSASLSLLL
jgi:hypothetical protein